MARTLLRDIYELGENMRSALEHDELDEYFELLEKRGTLLDALQEYKHPSELDDDWQEVARALKDQHDTLMNAVADRQQRMQEALTRLEQVKDAQRSYRQPAQRSNILNENLRV